MGQKIRLSSNIPITLNEKLSGNNFDLGFLYPCGKGLELKHSQTWFEKICVSLNKINSVVGFQNSDLNIPEYIAETVSLVEKQLDNTSLLIRYNAQTMVNDFIGSVAPVQNKASFDDKISKSLTKGTPMVIIGERSLKKTFPDFEEKFGLKRKVNFILNHEIAHNIDCSRGYSRGQYSLKDIMEEHVGSKVDNSILSSFHSNAELHQTKKMINQVWVLSLEHYADVLGFLNMRNQLLEEKVSNDDIHTMIDTLIYERKNNLQKNVSTLSQKINNPLKPFVDFEEKYKCMNHFTVNALIDLKEKVSSLGHVLLSTKEIEALTIKIVTKADLKSLYIMSKLDNKTSELLDKLFTSKSNKNAILQTCESKKPEFQQQLNEILGETWLKEVDKFVAYNKKRNDFFTNINEIFGLTTEQLQNKNQKTMHNTIAQVRLSLKQSFEDKALSVDEKLIGKKKL